ncbi:MAG: translation initiation factor IF-1A [Candidatus Kariarchaeaceae archaeon]|jgi:initiation factor 1A
MAKKKRGNNNSEGVVRIRLPEEGETLGQVIQLLGNRLLLVRCIDGVTRQVMISGKHKRRMWVNQGDVITLHVHIGMDESKGTMVHRYKAKGARVLHERGLIPEEYLF